MSIPPDLIKTVAETIGIQKLSDEVSSQIAVDLEYRLREILQDSIKMMKHSKRTKILTEDITSVLTLQNYEVLYGYSFNNPLNFMRVIGQKDLFCLEETETDIKDIINEPLPEPPKEVVLQSHWLVIEGVQPAISQNLDTLEPLQQTASNTNNTITPKKVGEKRKLFDKKEDRPEIPQNLKHVLSKELELYYFKVTEVVMTYGKNANSERKGSELDEYFASVLKGISSDIGLHQLVPYFSKFIVSEVANNISNLKYLQTLMTFTESFITNPNFRIEPYLNQLMPCFLTCLLGKKLCSNPEEEDHWSLRDYVAAKLLPKAYKIGKEYFDFQARVIKTLANTFLDITKPMTSHYGAIKGLEALGERVVQIVIIPNIAGYIKMINLKKESMGTILGMPKSFMIESSKCRETLLEIACNYLRSIAEYYKNIYSLLCQKNSIETDEGQNQTTGRTSSSLKKSQQDNENQTMQFIYELIRQEAEIISTDTSISETIALGELADVGKRYKEMKEVFGDDFEKSKKIIDHVDFFSQCTEWQQQQLLQQQPQQSQQQQQ